MNDRSEPRRDALGHPAVAGRPSTYTLVLNLLPLAHLVAGALVVASLEGWAAHAWVGTAWIYLLPPVAVRFVQMIAGPFEGEALDQTSRAYKTWWFSTQMQVVFNRLPVLEELLRLVPGVYAAWLRLWGSRASAKVYWAAGSLVTDRGLIDVGAGVVIGTRAVLAPHLAYKDELGAYRVTVARVRIDDGVMVGAYAGVGPGCRIEAGAEVPAAAFLRPYTEWRREGRRRSARPSRHA
jgi:hypothetical protein